MFDPGLNKSMWELALDVAIHAYNRTPHITISFEIPLKKFAPSASCHLEQIKRFGCIGYIKIPKPGSKFDTRAIKAILVGYKSTIFLFWHPNTRKFLESRHVRFNETLVYKNMYKNNLSEEDDNKDAQIPNEQGETTDWNWLTDIREVEQKEKIRSSKRKI